MIPDESSKSKPPCPDAPQVCICPLCGHGHSAYAPLGSALLDCLVLASDALQEAKRLVEEEVLP